MPHLTPKGDIDETTPGLRDACRTTHCLLLVLRAKDVHKRKPYRILGQFMNKVVTAKMDTSVLCVVTKIDEINPTFVTSPDKAYADGELFYQVRFVVAQRLGLSLKNVLLSRGHIHDVIRSEKVANLLYYSPVRLADVHASAVIG